MLIHMHHPDGFSHPMTGTVRDVVLNERFVFMATPCDDAGVVLAEVLTTITFRDEAGGTRLTVEARGKGLQPIARMMFAGMEEGWSQSLDKLEALVTRLARA